MKTKISVFLFILILAISSYLLIYFPQKILSNTVIIEVKKGRGLESFSQEFAASQSLSSNLIYYYFRYHKIGSLLKVGEYQFKAGSTLSEAKDTIKRGEQIIRQFTIPEGYSVKDIAKLLASKNLVNEQSFIQTALASDAATKFKLPGTTLEGYLYPDTYQYTKSITESEIIEAMIQNFKRQAYKYLQESSRVGLSPYQLLILASIVEKETGKAEERPLIAAVFFNRLKINMPLATDPSVIYGIQNYDGNIRKVDLITEGPYNTYKRAGLPPTPIANPGLKSIEACLNPNLTEYLFFVSKGDGTHYFSKTYEEHQSAVQQFQLNNKH